MRSYRICLLGIILVLLGGDLRAQFPTTIGSGTFGGARGTGGGQSLSSEKDPSRDTLSKEVFVYYVDNAVDKELFQDSSFINFHLYDPTRQTKYEYCLLYTSPSPRDRTRSRMPSSA